MTDERTLRIYLSESNRGEEWEWTCDTLHICLELIFGENGSGLQHWNTMETPIQAINSATGNSLIFHQTWRGLHSMKYAAEDLERGILNLPMTIWKNKTLFQHVDIVQSAKPSIAAMSQIQGRVGHMAILEPGAMPMLWHPEMGAIFITT